MKEYPIFVPFGSEHLAVVVTVPEAPPRGLVLLLQGLGSPRSHRYGLWTKSARNLAERGLACARLDYPEIGDSTGVLDVRIDEPPNDEALAVVEAVVEALGVDRFATVGNCMGSRTAFDLGREHDRCIASVCLGSPKGLLKGEGRTAPHRAARRMGKKHPKAAGLARSFLPTHRIKQRLHFIDEVAETIRIRDTLFLMLGEESTDRLEAELARLTQGGEPSVTADVQLVPASGSAVFQLPIHTQQAVIDALVDWLSPVFDPAGLETDETVFNRERKDTADV